MRKKQKLLVAKIGGNIIEDQVQLQQFLADFAQLKQPKILIHGGGKEATKLAAKLGIETTMIAGRRVTTAEELDIVVQIYAGLVNKSIVATLQKYGCDAIGMSGADANAISADKRPAKPIDYGYAGDIKSVNGTSINKLIEIGLVPVFCAVTHDNKGQLLNTNADTIAAELAVAMSPYFETSLFYCFELPGVLTDIHDNDSVIEHINLETYNALKKAETIRDGMLPKLQNCFEALHRNLKEVHIANAEFISNPNCKHTKLTLQ
ncbi:N-acetylglutamate kinase [Aquimarina brevivitae]|uniref:Acetylglutamate kinase n=2 Tax=Aquimarina brevivitae TaxID=323412 RepID=A0A4Q7NYH7_9FLAO|nr:N-acetylglutamate kinase [Aquimarina brevivitae]